MRLKPRLFFLPAGLWLAVGPCLADQLIDFESGTPATTPDGWTFDGDSSAVQVAATITSGDYTGGQAIRTDDGGASFAGHPFPPGPTITSIQADFLWDWSAAGDPTLVVYAWDDADNNGFQSAETTIGFGLDNDGQFELSNEAGELAGSVNFSADTWYRLTMTWGEPDGSGDRVVTLSAIDLTNSNNLGVVGSATMSAADFGVDPSEWDGVAFRMTRGTIDNILATSAPGSFSYVDASPSNTTLNSDPANFPEGVALVPGSNYVHDGTSGAGDDGLWTFRTDSSFASFENGNAFESDNQSASGDVETTADLITTVSLPAAGTYELVAVFSRKSNRDIAVRVGSAPGAGDVFDLSNALDADQATAPRALVFDSSFSDSRGGNSGAAYLGQVVITDENEEVRVFINGLARTDAADDERTQYEGIGYRLISAASSPELVNFAYDNGTGLSQVSITGAPGTRYRLVEADDLDFSNPDQDPVPLTGVTVGTRDGNEVIADPGGNATVQFDLGTTKAATFLRAVTVP